MDSIMLEQAGNGLPRDDEGNLVVQVVSDILSSVFDGGVNRFVPPSCRHDENEAGRLSLLSG